MISGSTERARAIQRRCCCPPESPSALSSRRAHLVPQRRVAETALDELVALLGVAPVQQPGEQPGIEVAVLFRTVGDVLADRLRERVRRLKHHPDPLPELDEVDPVLIDLLVVQLHRAVDPGGADPVVHPVETPEIRRLPAAGRADKRGDAPLGNLHRDVLQGVVVAVVDIEVLDGHLRLAGELVLGPLVPGLLDALAGGRREWLVGARRRSLRLRFRLGPWVGVLAHW